MNKSAAALFTTLVVGFASKGKALAEVPSSTPDHSSTRAPSQGASGTEGPDEAPSLDEVLGPGEAPGLHEAPGPGEAPGQAPGTPSQASSRKYSVTVVAVPLAEECHSSTARTSKQCKRRKSGYFEVGAGYQPDEKFIAKVGIAQDRLFGTKHRLRLDALLSQRRQEFKMQHTIPRLFGSNRELQFEVYNNRLAYKDFTVDRVGGSLQISRPLRYGIGVYSRYRLEQISTEFTAPQAVALGTKPPDTGFGNETGIVAALRSGFTYDNGLPRHRRLQADVFSEFSAPWLGSDYNMVRAGAKASYRQPLIGPFGLHLQGGVEGVMSKPGTLVPRAERLYFEGHSDVRGFGLGSAGFDQGSNFKATSRAELEMEILPSWGVSGALFYDAGIFGDKASTELAHSVGGSLIFNSPIGPLRLDLACPLGGSGSPSLLLGIGGSF